MKTTTFGTVNTFLAVKEEIKVSYITAKMAKFW